jgi:predicted nucleotidyltransferase component of viral defense system
VIPVAEVKRIAGQIGVDPTIVDHDYILGCYIRCLATDPGVRQGWLFKGGTALRKCYFENYRFSEDLDFTGEGRMDRADFHDILRNANLSVQKATGIRTDIGDILVRTIADDYGKESFEGRVYYRGPWDYGGSNRALEIHLMWDERVVFAPKLVVTSHLYSDNNELPSLPIRVYALEEILAEKLRAFSGQRRYAIARDVFDIHYLSESTADIGKVIQAFPDKCRIKGITSSGIEIKEITKRKADYENNWRNNLDYLVPNEVRVQFDVAWETSIQLLRKALDASR